MKIPKARLDQLLVDRGLAPSREKARALVLAGAVTVDGRKAAKPGHSVPLEAVLDVASGPPYVSRGGQKLAAALDHFRIDVTGRVCVDIGSSAGGFTDCLLQRGALRVHAVDVGSGQLDWKLRQDERVVVREGINARHLAPAEIGETCQFASCDVSFISLTLIVPVIPPLLDERCEMVLLVKPQFEVGKDQVGKGGIVRDSALHQAACAKIRGAAEQLGLRTDIIESPVLGAEGNREFLLYARH
ncbi:MAG: TlyA family RNA methyltransferase [Acidimicrobiia bacterium]|nr:TlyA family RNA methyltransferase [Acidimicrobiia bacterium]